MESHSKEVLQWEYILKSLEKHTLSKDKNNIKIKRYKLKEELEISLNQTLEAKRFIEANNDITNISIYGIKKASFTVQGRE